MHNLAYDMPDDFEDPRVETEEEVIKEVLHVQTPTEYLSLFEID